MLRGVFRILDMAASSNHHQITPHRAAKSYREGAGSNRMRIRNQRAVAALSFQRTRTSVSATDGALKQSDTELALVLCGRKGVTTDERDRVSATAGTFQPVECPSISVQRQGSKPQLRQHA